jgi:hypothetical protein
VQQPSRLTDLRQHVLQESWHVRPVQLDRAASGAAAVALAAAVAVVGVLHVALWAAMYGLLRRAALTAACSSRSSRHARAVAGTFLSRTITAVVAAVALAVPTSCRVCQR